MIKRVTLLFIFLGSVCYSLNYQFVKDGPVHEAYVVQEYNTFPIQSFAQQPPQKIDELIPEKTDSKAIWLPGYWAWSDKEGQFLWVSGLWRRPPPGKQWIAGEWKKMPMGWVWFKGFWSNLPQERLTYIDNPPPEPIDEQVPPPPTASSANYFWMAGYWSFDQTTRRFVWYPGRWAPIEPHWIYFPPQYIWREKGYIFVPSYWDWPIDDRGLAFSSIKINPNFKGLLTYQPSEGLHELYVLEHLFPYWPNYPSLFRYHYHFHRDLWTNWGAIPNWWNWPSWWAYPYQDLWALWWWWSHPGYPSPYWLTPFAAEKITAPPEFVVNMMAPIQPPLFVTMHGVVSLPTLLQAIEGVTGRSSPIIPYHRNQITRIESTIMPKQTQKILKPLGQGHIKNSPLKLFFGPSKETINQAIPSPSATQGQTFQTPYPLTSPPPPRQPEQGYNLDHFPRQPLQMQHRNLFMNRHHPQRNPAGPSIPFPNQHPPQYSPESAHQHFYETRTYNPSD